LITDENSNSCFGNTCTYFGVKVNQDLVLVSLVFQIGPQTAIPVERARRELSIDMAVRGPVMKFNENTT